jgi:hypothetical protein
MRIGGLFRFAGCAGLVLIAGGEPLGATRTSAAAAQTAQPPVVLVCAVTGLAKHRGALTDEAVCSRAALRISEALGVPVALSGQVPAGGRGRWVRLELRLLPRGRAEAALTSRLHGKATDHPLLAVQVMDKPMDLGDIDRLARLAGKTLAGS